MVNIFASSSCKYKHTCFSCFMFLMIVILNEINALLIFCWLILSQRIWWSVEIQVGVYKKLNILRSGLFVICYVWW